MHLRRHADCGGYIRGPNLALVENVGLGAAGAAKKLILSEAQEMVNRALASSD